MSEKPPPDGIKYSVKDNDWVGGVAIRYGFADWEKDVWKHGNNASLRDKRNDPHVLAPGDELFIPPWQEKKESGATEQRHKFKLKTPTEVFRYRVLDHNGEPLANMEYTLELEGDPAGGVFKQQNKKTDGKGVLQETIPSTTTSGTVLIPKAHLEIALDFGALLPMDEKDEPLLMKAAQQRLAATGFYHGEVDGVNGPLTEEAIRSFQRFCKEKADSGDNRISDPGEVDGRLSEKTCKALVKFYGC